MPCGGPSRRRLPSSMPAGYVSHTGYQYDSISRVAGQREPAPPSNFSKLGGFTSKVFITDDMYHPPSTANRPQPEHSFYCISRIGPSAAFWIGSIEKPWPTDLSPGAGQARPAGGRNSRLGTAPRSRFRAGGAF